MQQRFLDRAGGLEVVALAQQRQLVERAQVGLVVDDEQAEMRGSGHEVRCRRASAGSQGGATHVDEELVAPRRVGRQQPVVDARAVSLAELAANVQAQAGAAAAGREKGLEQIAARRRAGSARRRWQTLQRGARLVDARRSAQRIAPGPLAGMAARVVEQVDEDAAQVLGVEQHAERLGRQLDPQHALLARAATPAACAHSLQTAAICARRVDRADVLHLARRHLHHVVDDALQPLDVLGHHAHQLALRRIGRVLGEQRVGLRDRRQRIADLVRDAGRDAAHRGELFLAAARLHVAHVLEEQHAELLARRRLALAA